MKKILKNGISIRIIHVLMLICMGAIIALLVISTTRSSGVFTTLSTETENYIVRQKAANELMEASDYLTENVQRFTLNGDVKYMNKYFEEANVSQRRKRAIDSMEENNADKALVQQLNDALDESNSLMEKEEYAMVLVISANPDRLKLPEDLQGIELEEEHEHLSAEQKMEEAQKMVLGEEYYASKDIIRTKLNNALEMLDDQMTATRRKTSSDMMKELSANRVIVIILVVVLFALILLTALLGTIPLVTAHRIMKKNERLPMIGSKEFRDMSAAYNELYDQVHPKEGE